MKLSELLEAVKKSRLNANAGGGGGGGGGGAGGGGAGFHGASVT